MSKQVPMKNYQLLAGFTENDAISTEAKVIAEKFNAKGIISKIVAPKNYICPEFRKVILTPEEVTKDIASQDIALLHLSCGSLINRFFASLPCRKAVLYHNITPSFYFKGFRKELVEALEQGRLEAMALAKITEVAMADSTFNAEELKGWGFPAPSVVPLILDFAKYEIAPEPGWLERLQDGRQNILFVGRCAPNKRIEDLLRFFAVFQKAVTENSRLIIAGSTVGMERYSSLLLMMAKELELDEVLFTGSISQSELNACYRSAHLFVSMSEHEGFSIPLVEAMHFGVPILAYRAGAVPETLGGAGILFNKKEFNAIAELAAELIFNGSFRRSLLAKATQRIASYREGGHFENLFNNLAPLFD
jgi:glycosyltransferase involved in cell wall biosynthesis